MHDLDRTSFEMNDEAFQDAEFGFEPELPGGTFDRPFSEAELDALANELLQVHDEQELDQFIWGFLGHALRAIAPKILRAVAPQALGAIGKFAGTPAGSTLQGLVKNVITSAVPLGGIPGGGAGSDIGAGIRSELDWEGVPENTRD